MGAGTFVRVSTAIGFAFDNSFVRDLDGLYEEWTPTTAAAPELVVLNEALAKDLGADPAALREQADRVLVQASRESVSEREVTIMGDKNVPFRVLQRVMATCTDADYGKVSLATIERAVASAPAGGARG